MVKTQNGDQNRIYASSWLQYFTLFLRVLKTDLPTDSFLLGLSFTDLGETSCDEPSETNQILQVRNVAQLS